MEERRVRHRPLPLSGTRELDGGDAALVAAGGVLPSEAAVIGSGPTPARALFRGSQWRRRFGERATRGALEPHGP